MNNAVPPTLICLLLWNFCALPAGESPGAHADRLLQFTAQHPNAPASLPGTAAALAALPQMHCGLSSEIVRDTPIDATVVTPLPDTRRLRSLNDLPFIVRAEDRDKLIQHCHCEHHGKAFCTQSRIIDISDQVYYEWSAVGSGSFNVSNRPGVLYTPVLSIAVGETETRTITATISDFRVNDGEVRVIFTLKIRRIGECAYAVTSDYVIEAGKPKPPVLSGACTCAPLPERWLAADALSLSTPDTITVCAGQRFSIRAGGSDYDELYLRCFGDCGKAERSEKLRDALEYTWSAAIGGFPDYGSEVSTNSPFTSVVYRAPDSAGSGTITVRLEDSGLQAPDYIVTRSIFVQVVELDLDLDGLAEEAEYCPGGIVFLNSDDDDKNGESDFLDAGYQAAENDLVRLKLTKVPAMGSTDFSILAGAGKIRIWEGPDKSGPLVLPVTFAAGSMPGELWLEGIDISSAIGDVQLLLACPASACADTLKLTVLNADLDVNTDRDMFISNKDDWDEDTHNKTRGAYFNVNHDRDEGRSDADGPLPDALCFDNYGRPVDEDKTLRHSDDLPDITRLVLRRTGPIPPGIAVYLRVDELEDIQSIHIYKRIAVKEQAVWGGLGNRLGVPPPPAEPLEKAVTQWTEPQQDANFGIEGLFYANTTWISTRFDGEIDISLEFRSGSTVIASDKVRLKVAPWIMLPNTQASTRLWAANAGIANRPFLYDYWAAAGYNGLDNSGQLRVVPDVRARTRWLQDHVETGYTQRPDGPQYHSTLRLPYKLDAMYTQPYWPRDTLLRKDMGQFQLGAYLGVGSGDYGGNLELIPPGTGYPLGRILAGDSRSSALWDFLVQQEVQPPVSIPVRWLRVAHVDEVVGFTNVPGQIMIADPATAWTLMESIPDTLRGQSVFFDYGALPQVYTVSAVAPPDRVTTGVTHTGQLWKYIRIYESSAGAAGQVAKVRSLGAGYIEIDTVWRTGSRVLDGGATDYMFRYMLRRAPLSTSGWFTAPAVGDKFVAVQATQFWEIAASGRDGTPAFITVQEILADPELRALNLVDIQAQISTIRSTIEAAMPDADLTFIELPAIYAGTRAGFSIGRSTDAFTPGLSNFQAAGGNMYFPRQFSPRNAAGVDLFEQYVRSVWPAALFVYDWATYHRKLGEVHCGSTTQRLIFPFGWWNYIP